MLYHFDTFHAGRFGLSLLHRLHDYSQTHCVYVSTFIIDLRWWCSVLFISDLNRIPQSCRMHEYPQQPDFVALIRASGPLPLDDSSPLSPSLVCLSIFSVTSLGVLRRRTQLFRRIALMSLFSTRHLNDNAQLHIATVHTQTNINTRISCVYSTLCATVNVGRYCVINLNLTMLCREYLFWKYLHIQLTYCHFPLTSFDCKVLKL